METLETDKTQILQLFGKKPYPKKSLFESNKCLLCVWIS